MRSLTEPSWNFSSAPCGPCLTRSLKLPRPAARVTPELWFLRGCRHFSRLLRPNETFQVGPISSPCLSRAQRRREAFHEATQNRAATPFVIGSGTSYWPEAALKRSSKSCILLPESGKERTITTCCKNQLPGEGVENCGHGNTLALQDEGNDQAIQLRKDDSSAGIQVQSLIGRSQ